MKYATTRPYAKPEAAARKLIELANAVEAVQHGRIQPGSGSFRCRYCGTKVHEWSGPYNFFNWKRAWRYGEFVVTA